MLPRPLILLSALMLTVPPVSARNSGGWDQLKLGMTIPQALDVLGDPLVKTAGKGFEQWIYDGRAEVLFYGGVGVGWTAPLSETSVKRVVDVWQADQSWPSLFRFVFPVLPARATPPWRQPDRLRPIKVPIYQPHIRR